MKNNLPLCALLLSSLAIPSMGGERSLTPSIRIENGLVKISHTWPSEEHPLGGMQTVYFAPSLTSEWMIVSIERRESYEEESEFSQPLAAFPSAGFFKVVNRPDEWDPWSVDSDGDGLFDGYEEATGTDPHNPDTDGDGLEDYQELSWTTDPLDPDTDGDGLSDGEEVNQKTNPLEPDTDGDGLGDGLEIELSWNPLSDDSDNDLLGDGDEYFVYHSDGLKGDTDGDGMSDRWEVDYGFDLLDAADGSQDPDGDGLVNSDEYKWDTDPYNRDCDRDGMSDGDEVKCGRDPWNPFD